MTPEREGHLHVVALIIAAIATAGTPLTLDELHALI